MTPLTHEHAKHVFHLYVIRTQDRNKLQAHFNEYGIVTGIHYPTPLPFLKAYDYLGYKLEDFSVANRYKDEIISLPLFPELSNIQIEYIMSIIGKFGGISL